ncbi:dethiobiotin synthase [Candidatus Omnitrophota bacterium]
MSKGIFVVGTDTEVGKTVISAGLAFVLKKRNINVRVIKPIASGCEKVSGELQSEDAAFLAAAIGFSNDKEITPFRFALPLAPHVAATLEGTSINKDQLCKFCKDSIEHNDFTIIEGIGGLMVPLTEDYYVSDLVCDLALPVVVVSRVNLGAINHTLLTIEALRNRNVIIKGIILNTLDDKEITVAEKTNPAIIRELSGVTVLGVVPYIKGLNIRQKNFSTLPEDFENCIHVESII